MWWGGGGGLLFFFFFNDTATTEIYTLSLHDALPICIHCAMMLIELVAMSTPKRISNAPISFSITPKWRRNRLIQRMNGPIKNAADRSEEHTSELQSRETISYAVFCLKKKKRKKNKKKKKTKQKTKMKKTKAIKQQEHQK